MRLKYRDSDLVFDQVSYDKDENRFVITTSNGGSQDTLYYVPVLELDPLYKDNINVYSYKILANESCGENSIHQVYVEDQRIGWIFPIQALLSAEHDEAHNKYFLRYAFIATVLLLEKIKEDDKRDIPSEFILDEYVDSSKCILVIDGDNTAKLDSFNISNYMVSFFQYGYEYNGCGNWSPITLNPGDRVNLKSLSPYLQSNASIEYLFQEQFPSTSDPVIRFHLCYQVIELLIAQIFDNEFRKIVTELNMDTEKLFDMREQIVGITSEKKRIQFLFNDYTLCQTADKSECETLCTSFLECNKREPEKTFYNNIYAVRCLLVHKLYSIRRESYSQLEAINTPLLNIVFELLYTFHYPQ